MTIGYAVMPVIPSLKGMDATIQKELSRIGPKLGQAAGVNLGEGINQGAGSKLSKLGDVVSTGLKAGVVAGGALAVAAGGWGLKIAAANEQAEISFTTMLGSAQKARSFLDELKAFAAKTPFEFPELQTAASSLISAGVEASKVIPIMTTLGDVTAGMGTGSEGIKRATVALQQMQAAGKITGEDLNQLRDAGIPVYDLLAAATGKAKTEVTALAQAGKLGKTELDQLMGALESGKGLERFSGLMDKQSQSLTGMISTLKDTTGQLLATAMTPLVSLAKQGLPLVTEGIQGAFDAADRLAPKLTDTRDAFMDVVDEAKPVAVELGQNLVPVVENLADLAGGVLPPALRLAGDGLVLVLKGANGVVRVIEPLTRLLADHEDVVLAVAAAYGTWKAVGAASDALDLLKVRVGALTAGSGALAKLKELGTGFATMGTSVSTGASMVGASMSSIASTTVSGTAVAGAGLAAFAAGAMLASSSIDRSMRHGQEAAERFMKSLDVKQGSASSAMRGLASIQAEIVRLSDEAFRGAWAQVGQRLNPFQANKIDEARAKIKELEKQADDLARYAHKINGAAIILSMPASGVERWIDKLNLPTADLGPKRLAIAIAQAKNAAEYGTPKTDKLADAYRRLADETSTSTERIDAWKDHLDAALDTNVSVWDAETRAASSKLEAAATFRENAWGGLDTTTAAGNANRDALSGAAKAAKDFVEAIADRDGPKAAALVLEDQRRKIEALGSQYGIGKKDIDRFLDTIGLTPEFTRSEFELAGAKEAEQHLKNIQAILATLKRAGDGGGLFGSVLQNTGQAWLDGAGGKAAASSKTPYKPMPLAGIGPTKTADTARPGRSVGTVNIYGAKDDRAMVNRFLWEQGR